MALTVAAVDAIRSRLAAVPAKEASTREVTRVEAVTRMRGEILALRQRGYSREEVAAMVSSEGCRVAAATLRTELSRRGAASRGNKRKPPREPPREEKNVANAAGHKRGHVQAPAPSPAKASAPQPRPAPEARIGGFVVREDSEI
jgi:hypothetical protein